jgi:hypothetical protein
METKELFPLRKSNISNFHGITKNGNAIVTLFAPSGIPGQKVILSRTNFNKISAGKEIYIALVEVPEFDLPVAKSLSFR